MNYPTIWDGSFILPSTIAAAIATVEAFTPSVLVLAEDDFNGIVQAATMHGHGRRIATEYAAIGIDAVIWAPDVLPRTFALTSADALVCLLRDEPDIAVMRFNHCQRT